MKECLKNSQIKRNSVWGDLFHGAFFAVGNLLKASFGGYFFGFWVQQKQLAGFYIYDIFCVNIK